MQRSSFAFAILRNSLIGLALSGGLVAEGRADGGGASARVAYSDLDLREAEDVASLEERVRRQATRLCRDQASPVMSRTTVNRCVEATVARAMLQVDIAVSRAQRHGEGGRGAAMAKDSV